MDYNMEELLPLVSELAQKYTGYESTSVTYEQAQTLMEAVLYCLNEYSHSEANSLSRKNVPLKEQYHTGAGLLLEKVREIRTIYNEISPNFEDFGVHCLRSTVQTGIPHFLKRYDIRFCPQNTVLTLAYPLLSVHDSLTGADAVYQYIRDIRTEQLFFSMFDRNDIISVLEQYNAAYRDMTENICDIILTNTIGHIAIRKPMRDSPFRQEEYLCLADYFGKKTVSETETMITGFIQKMAGQFFENNTDLISYLCCDANHMAVRIQAAVQYDQLNKIFVK